MLEKLFILNWILYKKIYNKRTKLDHRKEAVKDIEAVHKAISLMPGIISKIFVKEGAKLKKGDAIFAMEDMKI
jgi:biotin carboxyl carrier protein